jgi:hypothetical protein
VTINGSGFVNAPTLLVTWTGGSATLSGTQVTFVSSTQLRMIITTQNNPDSWTVKVTNPSGGGSSSAFPFSVIAPTPVITSLTTSPSAPVPGTFTFTINGSGFYPAGALILVTGPGCAPCTIPNSVLTTSSTSISGSATLNTAGTYSFFVQNGFLTSTGGPGPQSSGASVTVAAAVPTITSVSPNPVTGSTNAEPITINGTGFVNPPTVFVTWTGGSKTLSSSEVMFVSSTQLTMTITTQNVPDNWTVKVTNPSGGSSGTFSFTVVAPTPVITSLTTSPSAPSPGTFTFTINGSGFYPAGALILVTGTGCSPCTIPNNVLTTSSTSIIGPATLNTAGTYSFAVQNGYLTSTGGPGPKSSGVNVTVASAAPTITSVNPSPVIGSTNAQPITINGTGFVNSPTVFVTWTGGSKTLTSSEVTFVSSTQLTMTITTQNVPDSWTVKVTNPSGGSSGTFGFTVVAPTPVISSLTTSPSSPTPGTFTFTINGSGFYPAGALILVTGPGCTPCTIPNNVLTTSSTSIGGPATLNTAGTYSFVVQNGFSTSTGGPGPQSSGVNVTVASAGPTITSVNPNPVIGSAASQPITINGTGFVNPPTVFVTWTGGSKTLSSSEVTFVSSSKLTMSIVTQNNPDSWTVKVTNPSGGGSSSTFPFAVVAPTPVIVSLTTSPTVPTLGTFTFTINGSGFFPAGALILVTGPGCAPCTIPNNVLTTSSTTLSGPATLNTAGTYTFVVQNGFLTSTGGPGPQSSGVIVTVAGGTSGGTWSALRNMPTVPVDTALLLTDGTVMVHESACTPKWHRLTPDVSGSYVNGSWDVVPIAPIPSSFLYAPLFFSSAVLADGRVVVAGGEYNEDVCSDTAAETYLAAIYDPSTNSWGSQPLPPPQGWTQIGDSPNVVLPNGHFLLARFRSNQLADLDPLTLTWSSRNGSNKADQNLEEGWVLLPDGTVLTVDTQKTAQSERYVPASDSWVAQISTIVSLATNNGLSSYIAEIGPAVLRPDGTVFVGGATGHTAIYNVASGTWVAGPDFPVSALNGLPLVAADVPAALLPNGHVLLGSSSFGLTSDGTKFLWGSTAEYFEFDGSNLNRVPSPAGRSSDVPYSGRMLLLPTGQVLSTNGTADVEIYTPSGSANPAWAPTITAAPNTVQPGQSYTITGTQFNGLSQAVGYGDDAQAATNYPLVRIKNTASGNVVYCRTHDHSSMGVATGSTTVSTHFDVPATIGTGASTLEVVANGIASSTWSLTVSSALPPVLTITKTHSGGGFTQGQTGATYTVTIGNSASAGPTTGTVTVTESVPTGLTLASMVGSGWSCPNSGSTCTRSDSLAAGTSYSPITVTVNVAANAPSSVTNSVTVSGGGSTSATITDPTTITPSSAASSTTFTSASPTSVYGQLASFAVAVKSAGAPVTTGTVTFTDTTTGGTLASNSALNSSGQASFSTASLSAGSHTIQASYSGTAAFLTSSTTTIITVSQAPLTVTAIGQTITYPALPTYSATITGFVNSDTSAVLSGAPVFSTNATSSNGKPNAGSWTITPAAGTLSATNYTFGSGTTYATATLTVNKASLTVSANNLTMAAGTSVPTLTAGITGLVNGDLFAGTTNTFPAVNNGNTLSGAVTGTVNLATTASSSSTPGGYPITAGSGGLGLSAANYTLSFAPGTLTVTSAASSSTAFSTAPTASTYGQAVSFTASVTANSAAVTAGTVTFTDTTNSATLSSNVALNASGQASFTVATLTAGSHTIQASYSGAAGIAASSGTATIAVSKAPLTVTANAQSITYGVAPSPSVTITGFVNGDTASVVSGTANVTNNATLINGKPIAGSWTVTPAAGTLSAANYTFGSGTVYAPGTLTVAKAPLTVAASNLSMVMGASVPTLTALFSGLVNSDTVTGGSNTFPFVNSGDTIAGAVTGTMSLVTTAASSSAVGSYPVTAGSGGLGISGANYAITFTPGTVTVIPATQTTNLLNPGSTAGSPGGVARLGLTLVLPSGVAIDATTFGITLTPQNNAPALTTPLSFVLDSSLSGGPVATPGNTPNVLGVFYQDGGSPLAGTMHLGDLLVTLPSAATVGQSYAVHVYSTSAALSGNNVALNPGADGTLTISTSYVIGDVFPSTGDTVGSFGDGLFNTLDLVAILRAVVNIGTPPAPCSDRFDAMDAFPVDSGSARGGDGILNTLDLITVLKRIVNIDTTRPARTSGRPGCTSGQQAARRVLPRSPEGALELVSAGPASDGWQRAAIYLRSDADLDLAGLSFSIATAFAIPLRFTATAGQSPTITDDGVAGQLALAWLNGWSARAGQSVLLGYVETQVEPSSLALRVASANAASDGREVGLTLASPRQSPR